MTLKRLLVLIDQVYHEIQVNPLANGEFPNVNYQFPTDGGKQQGMH